MSRVRYAFSQTEDIQNKYIICKEVLGHGTYGIVRKCIERQSMLEFAVKTIDKDHVTRMETLRKEVSILKLMSHPNILGFQDYFENEHYLHIVTPLCLGGELLSQIIQKTRSREGRFSEPDAARIFVKMAHAVAHCHRRGVAHRDIKPENFLFTDHGPDSELKLIDFGLSGYVNDRKKYMRSRVGSTFYVAPEVLGNKYTQKCDVWSIGIILFILLSGLPPFQGKNDVEILASIQNDDVTFAENVWNSISQDAKDLVKSLLNKNPRERLSAVEVLNHPWVQKYSTTSKLSTGIGKRKQISAEELAEMFGTMEDAQRVMNSCDADGNGFLEYDEFSFVISCRQ